MLKKQLEQGKMVEIWTGGGISGGDAGVVGGSGYSFVVKNIKGKSSVENKSNITGTPWTPGF